MKITTNPGSIIAACSAALIPLEVLYAKEADDLKPWWAFFATGAHFRHQNTYEIIQRIKALRAIAKHKRDSFSLELDEPWLTDIAIYLDPFEGGRI